MDDLGAGPGSIGEQLLQEELGTQARAEAFYRDQTLDHLNARMREFVAEQEMVFIATANGQGECDSSMRAGPRGFVQVQDPTSLAYPDYRGNGVMASLGNAYENPHIGMLFLDFSRYRIGLHVNGTVRLVRDEEMREQNPELPIDPVPGRRARIWVQVTVQEAYIHCSKHIPHLVAMPIDRSWGTDNVRRKGGDWFGAAAEQRAAQEG
ncbi:pyridoxamine 5'-phosphate oxidase family protein [Streptacidiphilus sp. PAMC 29251]